MIVIFLPVYVSLFLKSFWTTAASWANSETKLDEKTVKKRESKLFLLKEMCHGQITGSFKPTTEDWYKDVKW